MSFLIQWFYILALSLWVGGIVFFSFFTTPTIFSSLPKEMASLVITAIFPRYYYLGYVAGGIILITTLLEAILVRQWPWLRLIIIAIMIGSTCYAGLIVRPEAHNLKVELKSLEEDGERWQVIKKRFDSSHRTSVILNVIVLIAGLFLLGILAFRLRL